MKLLALIVVLLFQTSVGAATPMFGAGIFTPNTGSDCSMLTDRSLARFWACDRAELGEHAGLFGAIDIRLEGAFFILERDLSKSSDRAFDDYMTIAHSLPVLLRFACYPNRPIGQVPKAIFTDLNGEMGIQFNGDFRRKLTNTSRISAWEVSAEDVYQQLGPQCQDHVCEFAWRRDRVAFWECYRDQVREQLIFPSVGLGLLLEGGRFRISAESRSGFATDASPKLLLDKMMDVMTSIGCHPELKLINVPISDFDISVIRDGDHRLFEQAANLLGVLERNGISKDVTFSAVDGYVTFGKICKKLMG